MDIEAAAQPIKNREEGTLGDTRYRLAEKWGSAVGESPHTGFVVVPEVLLRGQANLGIRSTEMVVLQNILMHWWRADQKPFPSNESIAKRMGVRTRTVQRAMQTLQQQGLIDREVTRHRDDENQTFRSHRRIDLSGLVKKAQVIAERIRYWETKREEKAVEAVDSNIPF